MICYCADFIPQTIVSNNRIRSLLRDNFLPGLHLHENGLLITKFLMKKSLKKIISLSLHRLKKHKEQIKKFSISNYREDFVITAQEEREGGFFRENLSHLKVGNAI